VVEAKTSYNILLGRPSSNKLGAIVSMPHLGMKFPTNKREVTTIYVDQHNNKEC